MLSVLLVSCDRRHIYKNNKMSRSLRSCSRQKRLQVQHIRQMNKKLRVNMNNYIEANIDDFNQMEFLSLFGLTQSNGMKNGQSKCDIYQIQKQHTVSNNKAFNGTYPLVNRSDTASDDDNETFKIRGELGKPKHDACVSIILFVFFIPN